MLSQRVAPDANNSAIAKTISQELCGIFVTAITTQIRNFCFMLADCLKKICAHVLPRWLVCRRACLPTPINYVINLRRATYFCTNFAQITVARMLPCG